MAQLNYSQLQEELKKPGTVLIDVRSPDEIKSDGKIPESKILPIGDISSALKLSEADFKAKYGFAKPGKESSEIICHCKSGVRAEKAAAEFKTAGFKDVRVYPGILDWKKNGGAVA